jgi:hypothetical protein
MIDFNRFKRGLLSAYLAGAIDFSALRAIVDALARSGALSPRQVTDVLETAGQGSLFAPQEVSA